MTLSARVATEDDAAAIARIYSEGIEDRTTFETRPRSAGDVGAWFDGKHPTVVAEEAGEVVAFAASFEWRSHERYRGVAEIAVYVARSARKRGAGRLVIDELSAQAQRAGFWKLLGALFLGNDASRALLRAAGFREVGVYERQAQLDGEWKDVLLVEKVLAKKVIFACVHNAGRSQMAAAFFNALANPAKAFAISAGTQPGIRVHSEVVEAMNEARIDVSGATPRRLTAELAKGAALLVTMGCGEECPAVPGALHEDWPLPDPKGKPIEEVRRIREELRARVSDLLEKERWTR